MKVLGWHGSWHDLREIHSFGFAERDGPYTGHDASVALWVDDHIAFAAEEERLDRIKHSNLFPCRSIRAALDHANLDIDDLDAVVIDCTESFIDNWMLSRSKGSPKTARSSLSQLFFDEFGKDVSNKLKFVRHHHAHLYGAWYASGFDRGLIAILDAEGEGLSGLIAVGEGQTTRILRTMQLHESLGYFYLRGTSVLGYRVFDEYKVMGLAPYGDPSVFEELLSSMYCLEPEGHFSLVSDAERIRLLTKAGLISMARRKGEEFEKWHMDFASALQVALEKIVLHVLEHFHASTGLENLCLAGGVAHNCAMNGVILRTGLFKNVYAMPVAHDGGNSLGAALAIAKPPPSSTPLSHMYFGKKLDDVEKSLQSWRNFVTFRRVDDIAVETARMVSQGKVVAWVQGRAEYGPRALGNRSIVADPRPAENKRRINAMSRKLSSICTLRSH
jgi:carbamoyltransferase